MVLPYIDMNPPTAECLQYSCCAHAQSCLTLCDPLDWSPPGSSVHGIFEARILEWASISYSRGSSQPRDPTYTSCVSCTGGQFLYHYCRFTVYLSPPSLLILCPAKVLFLIPFESSTGGLALLVQFSSVAQSCPTLCDPMNRSTPGLPVHHQLPGFTQTHVHRVGDAIQPSHPLSSPSPPAPNPSQHKSLFQ